MGSGKTEALKNLIRSSAEKGIYKWFLVLTPTRLSGEWDFLPPEAVVSFSPEKVINVYRQIRKYRMKCHEEGKPANLSRADGAVGRLAGGVRAKGLGEQAHLSGAPAAVQALDDDESSRHGLAVHDVDGFATCMLGGFH